MASNLSPSRFRSSSQGRAPGARPGFLPSFPSPGRGLPKEGSASPLPSPGCLLWDCRSVDGLQGSPNKRLVSVKGRPRPQGGLSSRFPSPAAASCRARIPLGEGGAAAPPSARSQRGLVGQATSSGNSSPPPLPPPLPLSPEETRARPQRLLCAPAAAAPSSLVFGRRQHGRSQRRLLSPAGSVRASSSDRGR